MKAQKHVYLVAMLWLLALTPSIAQGNWSKFSPPAGDFSIMMPAGVEEKLSFNKDGTKTLEYVSKDGQGHYKVSQGIAVVKDAPREDLHKFVSEGLQKTAQKKNQQFNVQEPVQVSGKGWSGDRVDSTIGDTNLTFVKALSENKDVEYTLNFTGLTGSKISEDFVKSFEVDPCVASKVHPEPLKGSQTQLSGQVFSKWVIGALVLFSLITFAVIQVYMRIRTRAASSDNQYP